ncbi:Methyltransferase type 11 OS=Tsukamurella paurometabola (strain ATCC 8368 / DSM / CCUG 35730/ CIP 100753 / JCM 10117 / KCTC 9821 / NBRC 16120 / NCIMB 702349/ NCTC 13040) OX=521096 GN=Tpau_2918 PE=4 SV=1 [Tsukamurella paurometabola]|uniref:Methyltransferase type 11 n=1 Tax=Tsukamurella paurometabola (strain ATCC 8368 / DSM 20162 / CCUG 35730 / CIP 100753 / JCM 10117 / KCTC 9821 / NBRC 16120 / NCIMB 702349 / NCTC 13040) TaxID=521096 RepID=D5UU13_TSUPD|nr:class I SAM-dependent methyltransferase [Tsukamurella paurometabola]ADG79516.1 Methyltransferase type 11 [Tsukamurella paurometabola DSM 20162]SUP36053.1 Probable S-adenosylmethionine-dependent methyltransferase MSMEG_2350 [Tsukamurella paurometabola]
MCDALPLTGERTVPGIPEENYWFRRHEIAYLAIADRYAGRTVFEAGSGEGYGAALLAEEGATVTALDYDESAVAHVRSTYPKVTMLHGNLAELPLDDASVDAVVNFQVIEHLWDQPQFLREVARVLRPGGELVISTPNRVTFSPGRDTPLNPFHTRELNSDELTELLEGAGLEVTEKLGVYHGARLAELDRHHGGSFIDAQIDRSLAGEPWPEELSRDVAGVAATDFDVRPDAPDSLDLFFYARKSTP